MSPQHQPQEIEYMPQDRIFVMDTKHPLYHLLYGVEGEEWPRWLGHLPWDVREQYKRIVVTARAETKRARS